MDPPVDSGRCGYNGNNFFITLCVENMDLKGESRELAAGELGQCSGKKKGASLTPQLLPAAPGALEGSSGCGRGRAQGS